MSIRNEIWEDLCHARSKLRSVVFEIDRIERLELQHEAGKLRSASSDLTDVAQTLRNLAVMVE